MKLLYAKFVFELSSTIQTFSFESKYQPYKCVILEPLSATGLRSIRYAQEIPLVRLAQHVYAGNEFDTLW